MPDRCKCKLFGYRLIDLWVLAGGSPDWCPLKCRTAEEECNDK